MDPSKCQGKRDGKGKQTANCQKEMTYPPASAPVGYKPLEQDVAKKQFDRPEDIGNKMPAKEKLHASTPVKPGRGPLDPNRIAVGNTKNGKNGSYQISY